MSNLKMDPHELRNALAEMSEKLKFLRGSL